MTPFPQIQRFVGRDGNPTSEALVWMQQLEAELAAKDATIEALEQRVSDLEAFHP